MFQAPHRPGTAATARVPGARPGAHRGMKTGEREERNLDQHPPGNKRQPGSARGPPTPRGAARSRRTPRTPRGGWRPPDHEQDSATSLHCGRQPVHERCRPGRWSWWWSRALPPSGQPEAGSVLVAGLGHGAGGAREEQPAADREGDPDADQPARPVPGCRPRPRRRRAAVGPPSEWSVASRSEALVLGDPLQPVGRAVA